MATINWAEVVEKSGANDEFSILRGKSVQAYANLEQKLFSIFANLTEMKDEIAAIVFFKITNSGARNKVLDKLLRKKFGATFNLFRNSFFRQIKDVDEKRNQIVHWNEVTNIVLINAESGDAVVNVELQPPDYWMDFGSDSPEIGEQKIRKNDLAAFIKKCNFFSTLAWDFNNGMAPKIILARTDEDRTLLEMFSQAIVYPPPEGDPLFQIYKKS